MQPYAYGTPPALGPRNNGLSVISFNCIGIFILVVTLLAIFNTSTSTGVFAAP